eukprot:jgi/Astpho2/4248/Aster-x0621
MDGAGRGKRTRLPKKSYNEEAEPSSTEWLDLTADNDEEIPTIKNKRARKTRAASHSKSPAQQRVDRLGKSVRYAANPSQQAQERMDRTKPGSGHTMFLLERKGNSDTDSGPSEEFTVLGVTNNVYTVKIGLSPSCSCPDAAKGGRLCKHHFFCMLRVLKLPEDDPRVWQRGLLPEEVEDILMSDRQQGHTDSAVMAAKSLRNRYKELTGASASKAGHQSHDGQRPVEGDCPICCDELKADSAKLEEKLCWCASCGNNVHAECFKRWAGQKGSAVTCVYCRAPWLDGVTGKGPATPESTYVNLNPGSTGPDLYSLYGDTARWIR